MRNHGLRLTPGATITPGVKRRMSRWFAGRRGDDHKACIGGAGHPAENQARWEFS
jgi:hypothetical protein